MEDRSYDQYLTARVYSPTSRQRQKDSLSRNLSSRLGALHTYRNPNPQPSQTELYQMKLKAIQIEKTRQLRHAAATRIQATWRGYQDRKLVADILDEFQERYKFVKLEQIRLRLVALFAPWKIFNAVMRWWDRNAGERLKLLNAYSNYCALFIQKIWRGWTVYRRIQPYLQIRKAARRTLIRLVHIWKGRQIVKFKCVRDLKQQLLDMKGLINDLQSEEAPDISRGLSTQYENLLNKYRSLLNRLYTGQNWLEIAARQLRVVEQRRPSIQEQNDSLNMSIPESPKCATPKKKFTNFLRRSKNKYDPRAAVNNDPKAKTSATNTRRKIPKKPTFDFEPPAPLEEETEPTGVPAAGNDDSIVEEKTIESSSSYNWMPLHEQMASEQQEEKPEVETKPKFAYLKRKSKNLKPAKPKIQAKKRIDCWAQQKKPQKSGRAIQPPQPTVQDPEHLSEEEVKTFSSSEPDFDRLEAEEAGSDFESLIQVVPPPPPPAQPEPPAHDPIEERVLELEAIFTELEQGHVSIEGHLLNRDKSTEIPQFSLQSYFITHYTDEIYFETIDALENHYSFLCSEETV